MAALSLERERAKLAWNQVKQLEKPEPLKSYHSLVRGFPAMMQSMGIGQAVAFLMAKSGKEEAHKKLLMHLNQWAFHERGPIPWSSLVPASGNDRLLQQLMIEEPEIWWLADREVVAFSVWLKRLAESLAR